MSTNLKVNNLKLYILPKGFRVGCKGKVIPPSQFYAQVSDKGQRRKVRKLARRNGFIALAAAQAA